MRIFILITMIVLATGWAMAQPKFGAESLLGAEFKYEETPQIVFWNPPPQYSAPPDYWRPPQGYEEYAQFWAPPEAWGEDKGWEPPPQF